MSLLKRPHLLCRLLQRRICNTPKVSSNFCPPTRSSEDFEREIVIQPNLKKLKENQRKFQVDDGLPVWLKGGFKDKLLLQITLVGLTVCLVMSGEVLYYLVMKDFS